MYRIDSYLHPEIDNIIVIKVYNDKLIIMTKLLELNFNANKDPTFVDSGYQYESLVFNKFIENMKDKISDSFSFDDQERIDNIEYINNDNSEHLLFKIHIELSNLLVIIPFNDDTRDNIVNDLKMLSKIIDTTIKNNLEAIEKLENYGTNENI